jgi:glycosyltransferase involved in cell wall biosynthesis
MPASAPISVLIPAHNAEAFLADTIRSVHTQSLEAPEIVVAADACIDRTSDIAAELGAKVVELSRRNMAAALNVAVNASTQPWIAFLDADDTWKKTKLACQWKAIEACPTAALISCDYYLLQRGRTTSLPASVLNNRWKDSDSVKVGRACRFVEKADGEFLSRLELATICVMVRREVFDHVGLFDEGLLFGQTLEFFARVLACYPLAFVEKPLAYHRRHERNHTGNLEGYWPTYISIINGMLKHPGRYPKGTGEAYRRKLKTQFHSFERDLARRKKGTAIGSLAHPNKPNHP